MTQYRVLLRPALIVPETSSGKLTIAEEGTIVKLMDMRTMFRDRTSPMTRRADEILIGWGKRGREQLGWLAITAKHTMKNVNGPLFLVTTRDKARLTPWDRIRHAVARADAQKKNKRRWWLIPWCVALSEKHLSDMRKTIREFGGKPPKPTGESDKAYTDAVAAKLCKIILKTELDTTMATAAKKSDKKSDKKSTKKTTKPEVAKKSAKKVKPQAAEVTEKKTKSPKKFNPRTRDYDDFVVRRLVKENPRKAGTDKAKMWDKLKKGMSVIEFVEKGGTRGAVAKYVAKGWAKLVPPKGDDE